MCAGHAIGVWAGFVGSVLAGLGEVGWEAAFSLVITVLRFLASTAVVVLGGRLVGLAIVSCASGLVLRYSMLLFLRRRCANLFSIAGAWRPSELRAMVRPSLQLWLVALGAFLTLQTGQYFIGWVRSTAEIPAYAAAYTLVLTIQTFAKSPISATGPFISQAWQAGDLEKAQSLLIRNIRLGMVIMLAGAAVLLACGREVCDIWLGPGHFVGYPILAVFIITLVLDCQHAIAISAGIATGDIPYAPWVFTAGILTLVLTAVLIGPLGLFGVALSTLLAYGVTVNWYAVYRPLRRIRLSIRVYFRKTILPLMFIGAALVCFSHLVGGAFDRQLLKVLVTSACTAVLMIVILYTWAFTPNDRIALRRAVVRLWPCRAYNGANTQ
jgi:O-antigen/teichoic acid export membrane protein